MMRTPRQRRRELRRRYIDRRIAQDMNVSYFIGVLTGLCTGVLIAILVS